jgi:hypothetical protein
MGVTLKQIHESARQESKRRGFRSIGIYHFLWATRTLDPSEFDRWLSRYAVDKTVFIKMLENTLRPRRAGGGVPRDRREAALLEDALGLATRLANERGETPNTRHLGEVISKLSQDPIQELCERFLLDYSLPE